MQLVVGGSTILFRADAQLSLHEDGSVSSGYLVGPALVSVEGWTIAFGRGPRL